MTNERTKKIYIFNMLDELYCIIVKTEEPLYNLKLIDNAYYYGYNHKRINEPLPKVPLKEPDIVQVLYTDIKAMSRRIRDLHPLLSTGIIVALTSFCLQVGFDVYMQSTLRQLFSTNPSILDVTTELSKWIFKEGEINENYRRRRLWEIGVICNQEKDLDNYISLWAAI